MAEGTRRVEAGVSAFDFPSAQLVPFVDSSELIGDREQLVARLATDGYLYLPGFLEREEVLAARSEILDFMAAGGGLAPGWSLGDATIDPGGTTVPLMGRQEVTHLRSVLAVLESPRLSALVEAIHGEPASGFDYKWLRAVGSGGYTGVHVDRVYMGRGSDRLMTAWVPFGDVPVEMGSLCVCPGSHRAEWSARIRETYGQVDIDHDLVEGWLSVDPAEFCRDHGVVWHTGDVFAGDVVLFGMDFLHASTTNLTSQWRISCDVRFQPVSDAVDERWVGAEPEGHDPRAFDPAVITSMADARADWGI